MLLDQIEGGVTPEVKRLLQPTEGYDSNQATYTFPDRRLQSIYPFGVDGESPYLTKEQILETFEGLQYDGQNHRRLTPILQEIFSSDRKRLMSRIDSACVRLKFSETIFDVVIIGTGPHGAAMAQGLRNLFSDCSIAMLDKSPRIGGQFRSYGPKPAFLMNSRVRKADRRLPARPRTKGSINPLGKFATLELSDVVMGNYAMNTDIGDICAVNAYLAADEIMGNAEVLSVDNGKVLYHNHHSNDFRRVRGRVVVDATGVAMQSSLSTSSEMKSIWKAKRDSLYFDAAAFYSFFATNPCPLERFHQKRVAVIGAGDSALTALEALIGNLPSETYGPRGVGRLRPSRIYWYNAPGSNALDIQSCLRSRYKNGIVQELPTGDGNDRLIAPVNRRVDGLSMSYDEFAVNSRGPRTEFVDIVIDCTNTPEGTFPMLDSKWQVDMFVGPANPAPLSLELQQAISDFRIPENTVSLWATMEGTDQAVESVRQMVLARR